MPEGVCRPPEELAELIEDVIFRVHRGTTPKYKNQVSNLSSCQLYLRQLSLKRHYVKFDITVPPCKLYVKN